MRSFIIHLNHYQKNFPFFLFSIRNENAKPMNKERKAKVPSFLTPLKKYTMIEEFKDELKDFQKILNKI